MANLYGEEFGSLARRNVFMYILLGIALLYSARLIQLQIIEGSEYRTKSETQAIKQLTVEPVRGAMYDRNGKLMVHNAPSFSITITPKEFKPETLQFLAKILNVDADEISEKIEKYKQGSPFTPIKIFRDADYQMIAAIEENREFLSGVDVISESKRTYNFLGNSAHLLGYTKEINEDQLKKLGDYYRPGDVIGFTGLEKSYENYIRGVKGIEFSAVNAMGQKVARFNDGKNDITSVDGRDLNLGIDIALQDSIEVWMEGKRGGVVALDPRNGEIIAFVSKPDYDIRAFSGRTPTKLYNLYSEDPSLPLFNRASMSIYPPGSTWKMFMALSALQEGIIDENWTINCNGSYTMGNRTAVCHAGHAHGTVNVRKAIHVSCNVFFYQLAVKMGQYEYNKSGTYLGTFNRWGKIFGFGLKTGADVTEEGGGILASDELFNRWYGGPKGWGLGRMINLGIGQGEIGVTPLQMAAYTATIANKGTWYQPHAVRSAFDKRTGKLEPMDYAEHKIPVDKKYFDLMHLAMYDVVNTPGGTASAAKVPGINVCGKTGTAQNPHGEDHAWFVCFAPMENPQIAICVMVENAGFGGSISAPIANKIITQYLAPKTTKPATDSAGKSQQMAEKR